MDWDVVIYLFGCAGGRMGGGGLLDFGYELDDGRENGWMGGLSEARMRMGFGEDAEKQRGNLTER